MNKNNHMDISIVIPALEESKKIGSDIGAASRFLEDNHLAGEIIIVDDGSGDDTADVAEKAETQSQISLKVIRLRCHKGKGFAIAEGMKQTTGEYVMFADSGCCVPYENVLRGLSLIKSGQCDIAHGSRKLSESRIETGQNWYRRIWSAVFHWFVVCVMKIPTELTDTQCGFKIYRGDTGRELFGRCICDGFMFDIEIIKRAIKQGFRIREFPLEWTCDRDSRFSVAASFWQIIVELMTIKRVLAKKEKQ